MQILDLDTDEYWSYKFYYDFALYEETSVEVSYDENGIELPFQFFDIFYRVTDELPRVMKSAVYFASKVKTTVVSIFTGGSSKGRTPDSDSGYAGSNPAPLTL